MKTPSCFIRIENRELDTLMQSKDKLSLIKTALDRFASDLILYGVNPDDAKTIVMFTLYAVSQNQKSVFRTDTYCLAYNPGVILHGSITAEDNIDIYVVDSEIKRKEITYDSVATYLNTT